MKTTDIWEQRTWEVYKEVAKDCNNFTFGESLDFAKRLVEHYKEEMGFSDSSAEEPKKKRASKKEKFDPRDDLSYVDEKYISLWSEWLDYKDETKKPYKTQQGAITQYHTWLTLSDNDLVLANAIIRRTIENSWQGIFALTESQKELYRSDKSPYATINDSKKEETKQDGSLVIGGVTYR